MPARSFEDSTGIVWEVFEVHRASASPRGVSRGLEDGWLAFVGPEGKRRLAPYPTTWETASAIELERLCQSARQAQSTHFSDPDGEGKRTLRGFTPSRGPRVVQPPEEHVLSRESLVRTAVRDFAHEARAAKIPAIEAMVRLKSMLVEQFGAAEVAPEIAEEARDMRLVRRWFVETYYFERTV